MVKFLLKLKKIKETNAVLYTLIDFIVGLILSAIIALVGFVIVIKLTTLGVVSFEAAIFVYLILTSVAFIYIMVD